MVYNKQCTICGAWYSTSSKQSKYCSLKCRKKAFRNRQKELKGLRMVKCELCGIEFHSNSSRAKYCSECKKIHNKEYKKQYNILHKDKISQQKRAWYDEHIEEKKKSDKERYIKNKDKVCERVRLWRLNNKDKVDKYYEEHKEQRNKRLRERNKNDVLYNIKMRIRATLHHQLKSNKTFPTSHLVEYSSIQLKEHLESQFYNGMSWDNMNEWEIHHIIPINEWNMFDENGDVDINKIKEINSLDNLIPLWKEDHKVLTKLYNSNNKYLTRDEICDMFNIHKEMF
jgi:hypothetical protein